MPRERRNPPKPVGGGQVAAWIVAMSVTALISLLTVVGGLAMAFGYTERTTATIVAQYVGGGSRAIDTCVLTLDYTTGGIAHRENAGVAWLACPEQYVTGGTVEVRIDPTRPDAPLVAGAEVHVFVRDTSMAVLLGIVPTLVVWMFGIGAIRRRKAERAALSRAG
ncbi:hypothetical protein [Agromyces larvae]|uniref:DUF3592 domain-containing protein n=1 Tax=Agromyces larvae TaxID=2929802 RepID=A0ABY4BXS6_9MICO|nr:hypothetical protein [Agromyces larvae]UOE44033.1 hypothetical protein MTO99_18045 [Agromyces larvae]